VLRVDVNPGDSARALEELEAAGATVSFTAPLEQARPFLNSRLDLEGVEL